MPGTSVSDRAALAAGDPLDDAHRVRVVVVRPEDHLEHDAHGCDEQRREQRPAEVVHREGVVQRIRRELEHQGVEHEDEHEAEREHERQAQRREHGREHRVQGRDDERDEQRATGTPRCPRRAGSPRRPRATRPSAPTTAAGGAA